MHEHMHTSIYPSSGSIEGSHTFQHTHSVRVLNVEKSCQFTAAVIIEHELIDWRVHPLVRNGNGRIYLFIYLFTFELLGVSWG